MEESTTQEDIQPITNQAHPPRLRIIGPRHPMLILAELRNLNILPYKRKPEALLTTANESPQTYQGAQKSRDQGKLQLIKS
ncbi:hypothetical protein O181_065557 [Austropuccinia psidii MF-1]|uniref:Uncharacterized protein n=1 Tax=Austropuccinia psidii MF-1 TaxID=1389203 RepID=A0A9Q3EXM4_9BASI|nr:hypothetical protein [Austropuccinia psidii MF-1]